MASSYNEKGALAHNWVIVNDDSTTETVSESDACEGEDEYFTSTKKIKDEQTLKEFFVQFYFQCVLSSEVKELEKKFEQLLLESSDAPQYSNIDFLQYVVRLCLQNRDIKNGKGLTLTTHMMLNTLTYYSYEKEIIPRDTILKILKGMVENIFNEDTKMYEHPYGSWKDIKYFLSYFMNDDTYEYVRVNKYKIIDEIIKQVYIPQMISDRKNMSIGQPISLCGKWLPRESGQFKLLAKMIAIHYHKEVYIVSEKNIKMYQNYRKLVSKFNEYLDTTQVHMTGKSWDKINFENVTSKTLFLNKESFLNHRNIDETHRHICKRNFQKFIGDSKKQSYLRNNNTVMPHLLVRKALTQKNMTEQSDNSTHENTAILNMQWNGLMKTLEEGKFMENSYCFPCIDVSPSMMSDDAIPLHCAIGLGLACAQLCKHNRAFTFSSEPEWIQYEPSEQFVERVHKTRNSGWGSTTNIHKMFKRILETCLSREEVSGTRVPQTEIDNTCLIIFSDMQFDCHEIYSEEELFSVIRREYKDAGYDNIPFLIFWNLRSTDTFPTIQKSTNMLQLSGNSSCLLEIFMKTRLQDLKTLDNWDLLKQILDSQRYILS